MEKIKTLIIPEIGLFHKNDNGIFERNEVDEIGNIHHQTIHSEIDTITNEMTTYIRTEIL